VRATARDVNSVGNKSSLNIRKKETKKIKNAIMLHLSPEAERRTALTMPKGINANIVSDIRLKGISIPKNLRILTKAPLSTIKVR
jgi:hypothetical protein